MKTFVLMLGILSVFQASAQEFGTINPAEYQYSMNITGAYFADCEFKGQLNDTVAAYVGSELRGFAAVTEEIEGKSIAYLTIFSNAAVGEEVSFQYYKINTDTIIDLDVLVNFQEGKILGGRSTPFRFFEGNEVTDPVIVLENKVLFLSEGDSLFTSFQWFYEEKEVVDSTNNSFIPKQTGSYYLEAINKDGCTVLSNTLQYTNVNLGLEDGIEKNILLYPNPCVNNLYISTSAFNGARFSVRLINLIGEEVMSLHNPESTDLLNLKMDDVPAGTYIVVLQNAFTTISKTIVKAEK